MWEQLTSNEARAVIAFAIANLVGIVAALRSWWHSGQARELAQDTLDAILIDLRDGIADAVAEGATQVITHVRAELAGKTVEPSTGGSQGGAN